MNAEHSSSVGTSGPAADDRAVLPRRAALAGLLGLAGFSANATEASNGAATTSWSPLAEDNGPPLTILFCGDSLAQGLYLSTQPPLRRRANLRLMNGTRHATGLTRSDDYDWVAAVREQVDRTHPRLMVAWIGANDFRPLVDRTAQRRYQFGTPAFAEAYAAKVSAMTEEARAQGAEVAWIGLPNMRAANFADAARRLNEIQEQAARASNALWIPSWDATSDTAGQFLPAVPGADQIPHRFRADDGVHFSDLGYRRIALLAFGAIAAERPEFAFPLFSARETLAGLGGGAGAG